MEDQLTSVPSDASNLVVSIGGNDALLSRDMLDVTVKTAHEALIVFDKRLSVFESAYRAAIDRVVDLERPMTICTIYNGNFEATEGRVIRMALMMFNDVIFRAAAERKLPVIDLRLVCNEPSDYANPIEPSGKGGRKIAEAIARSIGVAC